jgi:HK97 family phage major capsid protein
VSGGTASPVTNRVGGENPDAADATSNTTSATLSSLTATGVTAQSIASVTTGTGSSQPTGIAASAGAGKTGATGQTGTIIFDDLIDMVHSVDPAYRSNRSAFMTNDGLVKVIRKLKDSQNRPLWVPSFERGIVGGVGVSSAGGYSDQTTAVVFDTLLGYPLFINNDIAAPAASAKSLFFGDFSYYKIRDAMDVSMFRFTDSAYTKLGQVGFLAWARMGGNLVDTAAVKAYTHPAT